MEESHSSHLCPESCPIKYCSLTGPKTLDITGILYAEGVSSCKHRKWLRIIAHQQGASLAWTHPMTLFSKRKLYVAYLERDCAIE